MKRKLFFTCLLLFGIFFDPLVAQNESDIVWTMYNGTSGIIDMTDDLISYGAHAVWAASTQTAVVTTTGTLTQSHSNADNWSYSPSPSDKLILVFASGATLQFVFRTITGYTDGTVDDFLDAHQMDFDAEIPQKLRLSIQSNIGYFTDIDSTKWNRTINGSTIYEGEDYTINLSYSGRKHGEIGSSISLYDFYTKTTGSFYTNSITYNVHEHYHSYSASNSSNGVYAQDRWNLNNNTAEINNHTYQFLDAYCKWLSITVEKDSSYAVVNEPYHWEVSGTLKKDNQAYGTVQFDRTIVGNSYGPHLVVRCSNGESYLLNRLLNPLMDGVSNNKIRKAGFELKQNYPNPLFQSTFIIYETKKYSHNMLIVYDASGKVMKTLVNTLQPAGKYKVKFDAGNLLPGYYIYRLKVDGLSEEKKMILFKK